MPYPATEGLHLIAPRTYAYLQPNWSWGRSNCGLLTSEPDSSALLVDTQFTLGLTRRLLDTVATQLPEARIEDVALTHANGDHSWGIQLLPNARVYASVATADGMPHEIPPAAMTAMTVQSPPDSPVGRYMRTFFGDFDFTGIVVTAPTDTFTGHTSIRLGDREVELIEVGPAHTDGDVIVHVPDVATVFAGDILFINDHPVMWTGPIGNWINACDRILATGAHIIVPGHGPITGPAGVGKVRNYLEQVAAYAENQWAKGVPFDVAAQQIPLDGFEAWGHPERLMVTIGVIYNTLGGQPLLAREMLIESMTRRYQELVA